MTTERCPDCRRPLATADLYTSEHDGCDDQACPKCKAACWRQETGNICRHPLDLEAQRTAERARFEASRNWQPWIAEKERHWQTWCAAMRIER